MSDEECGTGWCIFCGRWAARGVVLATIERNSGPAVDVVVHHGCQEPRRREIRARLNLGHKQP